MNPQIRKRREIKLWNLMRLRFDLVEEESSDRVLLSMSAEVEVIEEGR